MLVKAVQHSYKLAGMQSADLCAAAAAACAELGLTGTKLGCGEGGCGACTVMVSNMHEGKLLHRAVNACLAPLYSVEGTHVVTVEGAQRCSLSEHTAVCQSTLRHLSPWLLSSCDTWAYVAPIPQR